MNSAILLCTATTLGVLASCTPTPPRTGGPTEPLVGPGGQVSWTRYHTAEEAHRMLREFAALYPDLVEVRSIGASLRGAELLVAEVTNRRTGPAHEKPALYLDGGIHARELTGSEVALYVLAYLVSRYGKDPQVSALLDTRSFYIRPKFNPDGSDLVLAEDQFLRSNVRPVDEDGDGLLDEDPPEDLDGDGRILSMRVPDPNGNLRLSGEDPRILVPRRPGDDGPFYRVVREGVDNDGDGILNEDGIGGVDMNRNFPRNWERWHIQDGSGDFPLSEPEAYATLHFLNEHRNVGILVHGHTSGGFVYRLPSAMDPAQFDPHDEALVVHLGDFYTRTTGRRVVPSATHATERRYGTLIQWAYSDQGVIGYVPEYSMPPERWVPDADGDGAVTEKDWHRLDEGRFGGRHFQEWTSYTHPQLGEVEIGGWHTLFWGQNPPAELLEGELEAQVPWILYLAEQLPRLEVGEPRVRPLGGDRFQVEVTVANTGFLPTNLTEQGLVGRRLRDGTMADQVSAPPLVIVSAEGAVVEGGHGRIRIPHLAGSSPFSKGVSARSATVSFVVRRQDPEATVRVTVTAEKAGTARSRAVGLESGEGG